MIDPFEDLDAEIDLPLIGVRLRLAGIYDDIPIGGRRDPTAEPPED